MMACTFSQWVPLLDYAINKKFIAAVLCENRNKPEMKCEGKCYLCKKIKKQAGNEAEYPEQKSTNKFQELACHGISQYDFFTGAERRNLWHRLDIRYLSADPSAIFHPPQA